MQRLFLAISLPIVLCFASGCQQDEEVIEQQTNADAEQIIQSTFKKLAAK